MVRKIPIVVSALTFFPGVCGAEPFRTNTRSFAGFQECTKAMWDALQLLSGDKALVKWNQAAPRLASLELVDEAGKRTLIRANCEEIPNSTSSRERYRGFIEFP